LFIFDLAMNDHCIFPSLSSHKIMNILVYKKTSETSIQLGRNTKAKEDFTLSCFSVFTVGRWWEAILYPWWWSYQIYWSHPASGILPT